ncbi:MAG TPA: IclR family transcriptional regulator [Caldimonas sp.]|jgi:DNA-binding IclR family transcriptional regulator|nr:IclR family transcriptional regulator [Caldimonas sp.]HEX2542870.1 IclR family transcriptional regulator [Caldimonas sp.]
MSALPAGSKAAMPAGIDKTVVKSLAMLEHLVDVGRPMGITQLALATGLQKSNVHRILSTLRFMGYVRSTAETTYEPTLRAWELGQRIHSRMDLAATARPHLRRLVQETDETSHLAIFDGTEIVYVEKLETANPVRAHTPLGGRAPAYCTASGKALLCGQPLAVIAEVARRSVRHTPSTLTGQDELVQALKQVRERGYGTNIGEFRPNVAGVAAPVTNLRGEVIAAVGIAGPLDRLKPARIRQLAPVVMSVAADISAAVGAGVGR